MMSSFFETDINKLHELPNGYWSTVALSTLGWTILYAISGYLLPKADELKIKCTDSEWKDLKSRVVSSCHALYSCCITIYFFMNDKQFKSLDILHRSDDLCLAASCTLGYFIYDYMLILTDYESLGGLAMFSHHICVSSCLLASCYYRIYHVVLLIFLFTEVTTPFVNARVLLLKLDKKDDLIYLVNGICMFLGFVFFRFSLVFVVPYILLTQLETVKLFSGMTNTLTVLGYCAISYLNTMWTYKIFLGLLKAWKLSHKKSEPEAAPAAAVLKEKFYRDTGKKEN